MIKYTTTYNINKDKKNHPINLSKEEKSMKKIISLMLSAILIASSLVGCGKSSKDSNLDNATLPSQVFETDLFQEDNTPIDVIISNDYAFMGLASFGEKVDNGMIYVNNYNLKIEDNVDEIAKALGKDSELLFATIPLHTAIKLYNENGNINVLAINNIGGLYLVENGDTIEDMDSLSGKTIYSLGEELSYETHIKYILSENGVDTDDIVFEYVESYEEAFENENSIVVMPQPYATDYEDVNICLDLAEEWDKIQIENDVPAPFITSVIVSTTDFIKTRENIVKEILMYINTSINALSLDTTNGKNPLEIHSISQEAIDNNNSVYIAQEDMNFFIGAFAYVLDEYDSEFLGGLPDDNFYYLQ